MFSVLRNAFSVLRVALNRASREQESFINTPFFLTSMVVTHGRQTGRTPSGGRVVVNRGKRRFEIGSLPTETSIDAKTKISVEPTKYAGIKAKVHTTDHVNLFDPKNKTFSQTKIKAVVECAANRHYVRRNVMVKGAIVQTEKGKARITSRPGQDGTVNAVLI